jgi:hypothetical protein
MLEGQRHPQATEFFFPLSKWGPDEVFKRPRQGRCSSQCSSKRKPQVQMAAEILIILVIIINIILIVKITIK